MAFTEPFPGRRTTEDRDRQALPVELLEEDPPTGTEGAGEPSQHLPPLGEVDEDEPGVDEIEGLRRQFVVNDVVAADLEVPLTDPIHPTGIDVGDEHAPRIPHLGAQPAADRATPAADLQAAPAGTDTDRGQMPRG